MNSFRSENLIDTQSQFSNAIIGIKKIQPSCKLQQLNIYFKTNVHSTSPLPLEVFFSSSIEKDLTKARSRNDHKALFTKYPLHTFKFSFELLIINHSLHYISTQRQPGQLVQVLTFSLIVVFLSKLLVHRETNRCAYVVWHELHQTILQSMAPIAGRLRAFAKREHR